MGLGLTKCFQASLFAAALNSALTSGLFRPLVTTVSSVRTYTAFVACPCGEADESAKYLFRDGTRFADTRLPVTDWTHPLRPIVIRYLQDVVLWLWRIENPGHHLNTGH